jgi:uncharacterized protein (DUF1778 family)
VPNDGRTLKMRSIEDSEWWEKTVVTSETFDWLLAWLEEPPQPMPKLEEAMKKAKEMGLWDNYEKS